MKGVRNEYKYKRISKIDKRTEYKITKIGVEYDKYTEYHYSDEYAETFDWNDLSQKYILNPL